MLCENCICRFCANNMELDFRWITNDEAKSFCYNCDTCKWWLGHTPEARSNTMWECQHFIEAAKYADYKAERVRKTFKILGGKQK